MHWFLNPFLWSLLFIFKWKLLDIPFIKILCSHYFPAKYIFKQTFWKYFSLNLNLEQRSSKAGYPSKPQINTQSYFYTSLVNDVTILEEWRKRYPLLESQQIAWRHIYHICTKHTILSSIFRNYVKVIQKNRNLWKIF